MRFRRRVPVVVAFAILLALIAQPASAIQYGQPVAEGEYPYVGSIVVDSEQWGLYPICSGALIGPTTFLTAAHCRVPVDAIAGVTFDNDFAGPVNLVPVAQFLDDGYDGSAYTDYAVIILETPVVMNEYAVLPEPGLLETLLPSTGASMEDRRLTTVGYGSVGQNRGTGQGQPGFVYLDEKRKATTYISNLNKGPLAGLLVQTTAAPGTGGGTCYGDSGGPFFLGDTNIVVAITVTGYNWHCGGADLNLRIDVPHVLEFLNEYT
jgi:secreted trypsin-like serine protease